MKEQNVAKAYAKALVELCEQETVDVCAELTKLNVIINENNNLENLMFLDVFTIDEKTNVLKAIMEKLSLSKTIQNFVLFMIGEKRHSLFPLVFKEVVVLDDHKRGFLRGTIEGSEAEISDEVYEKLKGFVASKITATPNLEYKQNTEITAGYKVTVEDLQLDATIDNQLNKLKNNIINF